MKAKNTQAMESRVLVGRRYVEHGFLDAAMRLFAQNSAEVEPNDWIDLAERMMERNRIADAIRVCEAGGVPLPREHLLALGDRSLERRDMERAILLYELATADQERWSRVVDILTTSPDQERRAIELAERHLVTTAALGKRPPLTALDALEGAHAHVIAQRATLTASPGCTTPAASTRPQGVARRAH